MMCHPYIESTDIVNNEEIFFRCYTTPKHDHPIGHQLEGHTTKLQSVVFLHGFTGNKFDNLSQKSMFLVCMISIF